MIWQPDRRTEIAILYIDHRYSSSSTIITRLELPPDLRTIFFLKCKIWIFEIKTVKSLLDENASSELEVCPLHFNILTISPFPLTLLNQTYLQKYFPFFSCNINPDCYWSCSNFKTAAGSIIKCHLPPLTNTYTFFYKLRTIKI